MIRLLIFLIIPYTAQSQTLSVEDWLQKYRRPCSEVAINMVCKGRLEKSLQKMRSSIVPKMLEDRNLPLWLSTVPIIESDYNNKAVSSANAVGLWQIKPVNIQTFYTKKTITKGVRVYSGRLKFTETITETKPTLESAKWIGMDPKVSTRVATWLLTKLFDKYKSWRLALLSYNSGEPRIDAYLKGEGKPLTFETLNYYQQLLAIQRYMEEKG